MKPTGPRHRSTSISRLRLPRPGIQPPDIESAQICVECACEIDARRRLAVKGCQLCRECAERFESMRSRGLR